MISETAVVEAGAHVDPTAEILQFAVVRAGAWIGPRVRVCSHVYIDADVIVYPGSKIKNGALLYEGVIIGPNVFVGPGVCFTNDPRPRAAGRGPIPRPVTAVFRGASIGANATILPGIRIGEYAVVGAGAVVTRNVPPRATVFGNPAREP